MNRTRTERSHRLMHLALLAALAAGSAFALGCNKPSEDQCRKAVQNVRKITGTDKTEIGVSNEAAIRSCRGNSTKESVQCAIDAKSIEELNKCTGGITEQLFGDDLKDDGGAGAAAPIAPAAPAAVAPEPTPAPAAAPAAPADPAAATPPPGTPPAAAADPAAATPPPGAMPTPVAAPTPPAAPAAPSQTPPPAAAPAPAAPAPTPVAPAPVDPAAATPPPQ